MDTSKQRWKMMIERLYKCLKIVVSRKANGREVRNKKLLAQNIRLHVDILKIMRHNDKYDTALEFTTLDKKRFHQKNSIENVYREFKKYLNDGGVNVIEAEVLGYHQWHCKFFFGVLEGISRYTTEAPDQMWLHYSMNG